MTHELAGKTILLTRAAEQAEAFAEPLRALGANPLIYPTIAYAPAPDPAAFAQKLERLAAGGYDWLIFTSARGVQAVAGSTIPATTQVAAVGPATAAACQALLGREAAAIPKQFRAEQLVPCLGDITGQRILLPQTNIAPPFLANSLSAGGAEVETIAAYQTLPAPPSFDLAPLLAAKQIDAIVFSSGSTARYFFQGLSPEAHAEALRIPIICIGPSTSAVCEELGLGVAAVALEPSAVGLITALTYVLT